MLDGFGPTEPWFVHPFPESWLFQGCQILTRTSSSYRTMVAAFVPGFVPLVSSTSAQGFEGEMMILRYLNADDERVGHAYEILRIMVPCTYKDGNIVSLNRIQDPD